LMSLAQKGASPSADGFTWRWYHARALNVEG
jgi:hypothetical protein